MASCYPWQGVEELLTCGLLPCLASLLLLCCSSSSTIRVMCFVAFFAIVLATWVFLWEGSW